jgi:organic hydroperoxide reductase OsmC/OhrA
MAMAEYFATSFWQRRGEVFTDRKYSRVHRLRFDGGLEIPASSSPHTVREPYSDPSAVDPEEGLIASLSSCHLLWFLDLAAQAGFVVEGYEDQAVGVMEKNEAGKMAITRITLRPRVLFAGNAPNREQLEALHHTAHEECFIAASIRADVRIEPQS